MMPVGWSSVHKIDLAISTLAAEIVCCLSRCRRRASGSIVAQNQKVFLRFPSILPLLAAVIQHAIVVHHGLVFGELRKAEGVHRCVDAPHVGMDTIVGVDMGEKVWKSIVLPVRSLARRVKEIGGSMVVVLRAGIRAARPPLRWLGKAVAAESTRSRKVATATIGLSRIAASTLCRTRLLPIGLEPCAFHCRVCLVCKLLRSPHVLSH